MICLSLKKVQTQLIFMMSNKQYMSLDDLPGLGNLPQAENK
jgi:hypothetical protein